MNEDELLVRLRAAFQALDPIPEDVLAAGRSAITWRRPDAALAELADDHNRPLPAGVRGVTTRLLTFAGTELSVEIEVTGTERSNRELTGRLVPACDAHVRVRHLTYAHDVLSTRTDKAGQFVLPRVPEGLVSLEFHLSDATSVVTSWVRL
ncbi:hypothetical protein [Actinomadura rudentiformis]|uniref:Carboxypeptidase regulatory-like domain-containing protein n=1 Tax=Actinomadura rudentiformis TaxID=359158 RepID=A0A6H9YT17_9ACTN|nr:hypothetical protein [Actinomadura rudentiformis]KAB2346495.1 hypothetical protein F8566_23885 [Actinomadura rudentiformis]